MRLTTRSWAHVPIIRAWAREGVAQCDRQGVWGEYWGAVGDPIGKTAPSNERDDAKPLRPWEIPPETTSRQTATFNMKLLGIFSLMYVYFYFDAWSDGNLN